MSTLAQKKWEFFTEEEIAGFPMLYGPLYFSRNEVILLAVRREKESVMENCPIVLVEYVLSGTTSTCSCSSKRIDLTLKADPDKRLTEDPSLMARIGWRRVGQLWEKIDAIERLVVCTKGAAHVDA